MSLAPETSLMFAEAAQSAGVVERQLAANAVLISSLAGQLRADRPRGVITYARGSSDSAATFAKYVLETRAGILTTSAAPSVASLYSTMLDVEGLVAMAISQSGRSPDILAAMAAARKAGALTLALVNAEGSPLAELCDVVVPLHAGAERCVAATKSYIASLAAILHLAGEYCEQQTLLTALQDAPSLLRGAWHCDWSPLVECLRGARGLYVIGRGPGLAIAQEAALKLKETCRLHAEAFSAAEVRHGPMALVGPDFPLLVFRQSDESAEGVENLVRDVAEQGAPVFIAGREVEGATTLPIPEAHELIEPMLQIQALYRAANQLALIRGLDPDRPPHLKKVTETI
jgi:glutamine---fructose-6-phosphate transaminase (isomerizing)